MVKQFNFDNIATEYDKYYQTDFGIKIDEIEKNIIKEFLQELKSKEIIEIGCGTGHWTNFLSDLGFIIDASDISEKMLLEAQNKNIKNAEFSVKNAEQLNYPDNSADNIIAVTSLEFVENQQLAVNEIYRILKPNGYFICAGLNLNSDLGKNKANDEVYKNAKFFTYNNLNEILSKFGEPKFKAAVVIENSEFTDNKYSEEQKLEKGAFIAAIVQKIK
ncbi:MAG: class I SAM-dependent methyltransferase [Bacteroidales bacterium]|nr:class I SAM-dependent methyltransferase [Bacteroidales bacterium]